MTQIGTDRAKRRTMPLWREALIVFAATGVLGVLIGLLPGFER